MGDDLEHLKTVFRSLVVSCPTQMNVCSLLRDYRSMMGAPVPITKYGYRNPVDFLQDRFSDCFLFSGQPSNPVLTLIVPNSLKHIDKFVQKQKVSNTKCNPKRRSVPVEVVRNFRNCLENNAPQTESNLSTCKLIEKTVKQPTDISNNDVELTRKPNEAFITAIELPGAHNVLSSKPTKTDNYRNKAANRPNKVANRHNKDFVKTNEHFKPNNLSSISCIEDTSIQCKKFSSREPGIKDFAPNTSGEAKCNGVQDVKMSRNHKVEKYKENNTKACNVTTDNAMENFYKKRLPLYNSSQYLNEELKTPESIDDDSGRQTASSSGSNKARQLEQLKDEIMELISDAAEGVWCTDLIRLYRERYHRELNFTQFGYTSIVSLMYSLEARVVIARPEPTGDWRLRARALPPPRLEPSQRARRTRAPAPAPLPPDPDDALPGVDYDPDVFPEDCMQYMESIEPVSLSDLQPGAMVEVVVGEVYSPSHFWFLRVGDEYNFAMEDLMDEMTRYYEGAEGAGRMLARGALRVGQYCAALWERDWHRSLVVRVLDSDTVKVRHVDYGTVDTVRAQSLRPLRRQWARLPAQAARARLAGVRPPAAGWRWGRAAAAAFLARVSDRRLVANVVAVDHVHAVAEVLLIDTSSDEDVNIGTELVRAGHADARIDSALGAEELYLFPRFEALEEGATPNYAEIHAYLRDGIALDYVHEYRAHVPRPPASPDAPPSPVGPAPHGELNPGGPALHGKPAPHCGPLAAPSIEAPLPPPYSTVPLGAAEYAMLSQLPPQAAHWFMMGALHAMWHPPCPPPYAGPPPQPLAPPLASIRPPPGFGYSMR